MVQYLKLIFTFSRPILLNKVLINPFIYYAVSFCFVVLLLTPPTFAIVNGVDLGRSSESSTDPRSNNLLEIQNSVKNNIESRTSFVGLNFYIPGLVPGAPCSGTYINENTIMTAAHCFLLNEYESEEITICINNPQKTFSHCYHKSEVQIFMAPVKEYGGKAPTRKNHNIIRIPKPDIAIFKIIPTNKYQASSSNPLHNNYSFNFDKYNLNKFMNDDLNYNLNLNLYFQPISIFNLPSNNINFATDDFKIVGQGCTGYISFGETLQGIGEFRIAKVILDVTKPWTSLWTSDAPLDNSGVCWGDSGGSLLRKNQDDKMELIGVISSMKTKHNPTTGAPALVTSFYSGLDTEEIQTWIKEVVHSYSN